MELLRIRLGGAKVLEIKKDQLIGFRVIYDMDEIDYFLLADVKDKQESWLIHHGSFDECHMMLNRLHQALDCKLIDI